MSHEYFEQAAHTELSLIQDIPDQLDQLRHTIDQRNIRPVSEVCQYTYEGLSTLLYAYPDSIKLILDSFDARVDQVAVTLFTSKDTSQSIEITVHTDRVGSFIIRSSAHDNGSEFALTSTNESVVAPRTLTRESVSGLLINLAVSPSDHADIEQARRNMEEVTSPDPLDPTIFYLLKNTLDTYASSTRTVQQYQLTRGTTLEDESHDFEMHVTRESSGLEEYSVKLQSSYAEQGSTSAFLIEFQSTTGRKAEVDKVNIKGNLSIARDYSPVEHSKLDIGTTVPYLIAMIERLQSEEINAAAVA